MSEKEDERWLELHDPQLSSEALAARVEERLQQRRAQLGPVTRHFPTFHAQQPGLTPAGAAPNQQAALHEALRQLVELPPPATHAALAPSPATRLPLFGRLWALIRSQAHQLVLFYVNRHLAHQAQTNYLTSTLLHELTSRVLAQQQEIDHLRAHLEALQKELNDG